MLLTPYFLALVPFVAASGVHKLKLQKLPSAASNPELESAYLAEKYGGAPGSLVQLPLMGSGGSGRRVQRPSIKDGEQLFWTQEQHALCTHNCGHLSVCMSGNGHQDARTSQVPRSVIARVNVAYLGEKKK